MNALPKRFPDRAPVADARVAADELEAGAEGGQRLRLAGRVMGRRDLGKLVFLDLVDRSGKIQLLVQRNRVGDFDLDLGDLVGVSGQPTKTKRGEPSLAVEELELLAKIARPLPDTFHGVTDPEVRYRQRYLDLLMSPETRADFVLRARLVTALRGYLDSEGFVEVETPVLQPRYGGAFAQPFVTHHNELDQDMYLRIATELYLKRLIVGGLEQVYEIGKDFRNESVSFKHQPEFTMLEWYEAYADYRATMDRIEECIRSAATESLGTTKVSFRGHEIDFGRGWRRVKFVETLEDRELWSRDEEELRGWLAERGVDTRQDRSVGPADRPCFLAFRRAGADRADDRPRLPGRALTLRTRDRRRSGTDRALRVFRRRHGARERVLGDQRRGDAGGTLRGAGEARRRRARRPRLRRGPGVWDAADGRPRAGHRPARNGLHRP